jgi:signal transduction histidine kinase/CheY-like chemotaxis protein
MSAEIPGGRSPAVADLESGGSELAALVRQHDWSGTPLGAMEAWPQSLRTVVNILLTSRYAMWMGWGEDLTFLYNDAYAPTLGLKHPWALGNPTSKVWAEIWNDVSPRIETVLSTGKATYDEGLQLFLERSGFREETYHTFSYSPLSDDNGHVSGMLCVVTEETERVISERRMTTLRHLSTALAAYGSEVEVLSAVEEQLGRNQHDLPFTITYLFDSKGQARLACATGISSEGHPAAPRELGAGVNLPWPAADVFGGSKTFLLDNLAEQSVSQPLPSGAWDMPPEKAVVVPIRQQAHDGAAGFLVAGINRYRRFDSAYAGFVELIAGQLAAAIASARAYEEERRRAEGLAELDRAKTAFFSNVSHEFRTPLTLMLGPVEDLLSEPAGTANPKAHQLLAVVHRNGLRLQRLVNTLLDFSRIEAGRAQVIYQPADLAALTAELASSFRSAMERANLQFTVDCQPLSEPVFVDREMWEKVVLNLLSNAFKYTLSGSVSVSLVERQAGVELSVTDTGAGIPEQALPKLFERFHRVEGTHGRTHEGTGIGLALVQELVRLHGGTVSVNSVLGQGSTFTVRLPFGSAHLPQDRIAAGRSASSTTLHADAYVEEALRWLPAQEDVASDDLEQTASSGAEETIPGIARSRVLVADDNADMRDYVRRLLGARHQVTAVSKGDEALALALKEPPDLVLTDVMMPGLDGFGLLRELRAREQTKTLPIILLSARAGEESRVEGLHAGADDYIVKPFTARELLSRVDAHLSLARMRREADEARRLSEVRLGLALETTGMVAWEWDPEKDRVTSFGDMQSVFGTRLQSSIEGVRLVNAEDEPEHRAKVERVARQGGSYHSQFRIRRADTGATAWLEERATGIVDGEGRVRCVVGVVADVTERKAVEEEIRRNNEELTKANNELEEFAYVASHDLQEPLRMVNIYSQLLLQRCGTPDDPKLSQYADFVQKGVERMEELISDLLQYSRVVHPEQEEAQRANLDASLEEALSVLEVRIKETGAAIARERLPEVYGDERQLALVFQNLLSNALKYQRPEVIPKVEIWAEERKGECVVNVRDNGIGFAPVYAERIFGLFKRLHKTAYPGTGLGLAICRRIIERYGGRIWASSQGEGHGAVLSFSLRQSGR